MGKSWQRLKFEMGFESLSSRIERLEGLAPKCPALSASLKTNAIPER